MESNTEWTVWSEDVRAAYWAIRAMPTPPEVHAAAKAEGDLHARRYMGNEYRALTRDERRLQARYRATIAAHDQRVLDAYRAAQGSASPQE